MIVCKTLETGEVHVFKEPDKDPEEFLACIGSANRIVMHNGIGFDSPALYRLIPNYSVPVGRIFDTLVVSRLLNYSLSGGHSLEAWGHRLDCRKGSVASFDRLTDELVAYCCQDVELTAKLYHYLLSEIDLEQWQAAIDLEHKTAQYCQEMQQTGFSFNYDEARAVFQEITKKLAKLDKDITDAFPPKAVLLREITPSATKHGTLHKKDFKWLERQSPGGDLDLSPYSVGSSFSLIKFEDFNPGSTTQIIERLNKAGWQPTEKTKGHIAFEKEYQRLPSWRKKEQETKLAEWRECGWTVSEENLATLPETAPQAAQLLKERLILDRRRSTLEEWFAAYNPLTKRVHGTINHIGAWTHRCSHNSPNMANIVSTDKPLGKEMRSWWQAPEGRTLIGVDADGIQLRVLAHYMDDPAFTEALINGRKEDGTDAHTLNQRALGDVCRTRDLAKTFIYSWLLGAGVGKTASILGCPTSQAKLARDRFLSAWPRLGILRNEVIPSDARRGFFVGFDGRLVPCNSEHLMLSGYLQNGEAVIMKKAMSIWIPALQKEAIDFKLVDFVHDEWVIEVPDDDPDLHLLVMATVADSIRVAGEELELKCPMKGNGQVGKNWAAVH